MAILRLFCKYWRKAKALVVGLSGFVVASLHVHFQPHRVNLEYIQAES
jgi:hypothetical protein